MEYKAVSLPVCVVIDLLSSVVKVSQQKERQKYDLFKSCSEEHISSPRTETNERTRKTVAVYSKRFEKEFIRSPEEWMRDGRLYPLSLSLKGGARVPLARRR